jgi:predicted metalloprotease
MRWNDEGRSSDLEDQRGGGGGGFGFGLPIGGRGLGVGGFLILLVLSFVFKRNLFTFVGSGPTAAPTAQSRPVNDPKEEPEVHFVSFVLDDAQRTWTALLEQRGVQYRHAKLVLFREAVRSGCGVAEAATGPFYCPADEKVYIDLSFYDELKQRFGAPGDFAQAYVLAHEIGHHVQKLLGIEQQVQRAMGANAGSRNGLSVKLELQADCFAGVWAHSTQERKLLEAGDAEEALRAASAVGDDRLQRQATGQVNPDTFTHGTSEQRMHWFQQGMQSGDIDQCNTFGR